MLPSVTRVFTLQQPLQLLNIIYTNRICQATTTDVCSESSCLSTDNTVCLGQLNKSCRVNNKYTSGLIRKRRWGIWRFPQTPCRGEGNKKMPWPKQGWVWHTHRSQGDHRSCLQITYRAWIIQAEAAGSMRTDRWELTAAALAGFILSSKARKPQAPAKKILCRALPVLWLHWQSHDTWCFTDPQLMVNANSLPPWGIFVIIWLDRHGKTMFV